MKKIKMRKVLLFLVLFPLWVMSQSPLENNKFQLNAGLGTSGWGTPVYLGLDYGVGKNLTIGSEVSYRSYESYGFKMTILGIQGNANYHFDQLLDLPSKWNVYSGLSANYFSWSYKDEYAKQIADNTSFGIGIQIGGRYFFNEKIGLNLELGGGNATSGAKIGITYKL